MSRPSVPFSLPKVYGTTSCLYKLSFNDRYVIIKAKNHEDSVKTMQKSLNQFERGSEFQRNPNNRYFPFFEYVCKNRNGMFLVEIILESDNIYSLLKEEQLLIDKNRHDKKFLLNATEAYLPDLNETTGMYGWVPRGVGLAFLKWQKKRPKVK